MKFHASTKCSDFVDMHEVFARIWELAIFYWPIPGQVHTECGRRCSLDEILCVDFA